MDLPGTGSLDNLGVKTTGDMLETGSSPYDLLKERGIPSTLSDPEIKAANAFDLRMQGPEANKGLGEQFIGENSGDNWLLSKKGKVDPKSTPNFGHTFSEHGEGSKNNKALLDRVKGGTPQGQWKDNQKAAEFLNNYGKIPYSDPPVEINIPKGLGQVIKPNGDIVDAIKARVVINRKTGKIRSAFPIL